ncbi:glycosyltransferase family 2 protein [Paraglaciecola sp. 20A4]|uniref:glycosyltransferase family 2 protein n=1 Tax=Paraglaciecola sp. 20A4 TaxID=2687288 RepID=UPI00140B6E20|nr:glycosyltransferase family 2 protein [Paraglaciecola sp. 20A4]
MLNDKLNFEYKLCIGVPLYNEHLHVEETLISLKKQPNRSDVLYIVSDNASTDGTWEKCNEIVGDDPRFLLIRQNENIGAFINSKLLFENCKSEYFMWLGGHDYISDGYINSAIDVLDSNPDIALTCGIPYKFVDDSAPEISMSAMYNFSPKKLGRYIQSVRQLSDCTIVQSVFRRKCLNGFEFRETKSYDHIIISRLLWFGRLYFMPVQGYFRRFFHNRDVSYAAYTKRITGTDKYLSKYDYVKYYLDDFALLYKGDERMQRYVEYEIIDILQNSLGVESLTPNDGVTQGY